MIVWPKKRHRGREMSSLMYKYSFNPSPQLLNRKQAQSVWSVDDVRQLRCLASEGAPLTTITQRLRRTESAIRNKASEHGISLRNSRRS